jgi:ribonuclease P protein component
VRESFRHNLQQIQGLDIVVINNPAAAIGSNRELFASLEEHWQRCAAKERNSAGPGTRNNG